MWTSKSHTGSTTLWDRLSYFSTVYDLGYWAAQHKMPGVPASGPGSTLDAAKNAITTIEQLIREFEIELFIDAPCGDMTWMSSVDLRGVDYVGIDVVQSVIASNIEKHPSLSFMALDVADESSVDQLRSLVRGRRTLILCRHLLFHLPVQDGRAVLRHLHASGASYLLTSTYVRADDYDSSYILANGHRTNLLRGRGPTARATQTGCIWTRTRTEPLTVGAGRGGGARRVHRRRGRAARAPAVFRGSVPQRPAALAVFDAAVPSKIVYRAVPACAPRAIRGQSAHPTARAKVRSRAPAAR